MRPYQVVIWGATGFTGKLVCEHIARDYQSGLKWAIAGRSKQKLEAVRSELCKINPALQSLDIVLADLDAKDTLRSLAESTKVLITTAGPYTRVGTPVVEACATAGTHYCDLTGEPNFVRASMRSFDDVAKASGARIVHCCGYDSVPSDMTALLVADGLKSSSGCPVAHVCTLQLMKGGGSGGTIESGLEVMKQGESVRKEIQSPYCLDPPGSRYEAAGGPDKGESMMPTWDEAAQCWTGPFIMAAVNGPVVRRSNALLGYTYGEQFTYSERIKGSSWLGTFFKVSLPYIAIGALFILASKFAWLRAKLPMPGEGPSKETQTTGFFRATAWGLSEPDESGKRVRVVAELQDRNRDPGYWSTSRMLLESALCMALQEEELARDPYASKNPAGVLTPAAALGLVLVGRLKRAGYEIDVKSDTAGTK